jgi:hypothetical protein
MLLNLSPFDRRIEIKLVYWFLYTTVFMKTGRVHFLAYLCVAAVLIVASILFYLSENFSPFFISYFSGFLCIFFGCIKVANHNRQIIEKAG